MGVGVQRGWESLEIHAQQSAIGFLASNRIAPMNTGAPICKLFTKWKLKPTFDMPYPMTVLITGEATCPKDKAWLDPRLNFVHPSLTRSEEIYVLSPPPRWR